MLYGDTDEWLLLFFYGVCCFSRLVPVFFVFLHMRTAILLCGVIQKKQGDAPPCK